MLGEELVKQMVNDPNKNQSGKVKKDWEVDRGREGLERRLKKLTRLTMLMWRR